MFHIAQNTSEALLNNQFIYNRDRISRINILFKNRNRANSIDDYNLFNSLNSICYDTTRTFPQYEPNQRVVDSKNSLLYIIKSLRLGDFSSYCDVGCGMGYYPRAAAELNCKKSVGIDNNDSRFHKDYLHDYKGSLRFICTDISDDTHDIGKFKLVTSFAAFEHFSNPYGMLNSMAKLVEKNGYLYINFSPIYRSTDGYHMYRSIQIPWYHLFFTEKVCQKYYNDNNLIEDSKINYFNEWSALDFLVLFSNYTELRLITLQPRWNFRHLWYAKLYPHMLPPYGIEELMVGGFEVLYKKC